MKHVEDKNYEEYIEAPNYRSLNSDDISWYLAQKNKKGNEALRNVKHIAIDIDNNLYARNIRLSLLEKYKQALSNLPEEEQQRAIKRVQLGAVVADTLLEHMKESLQQFGTNDFCKKLLISNTDGLHTYAFTYGVHNGKPFFVTFSQTGDVAFKEAMKASKTSSNNLYKEVEKHFKDSLYSIYSVTDNKSCGTIALKIMKYLKYKDIQNILDNNAILQNRQCEKFFSPTLLPRKLVQYIQSIDNIRHHDENYDKNNVDRGKQPGTVFNKIKAKNRIKTKHDKEKNQYKDINTTAEVKQKHIINRMTVDKELRKACVSGISI